jgi:hypothetical protein
LDAGGTKRNVAFQETINGVANILAALSHSLSTPHVAKDRHLSIRQHDAPTPLRAISIINTEPAVSRAVKRQQTSMKRSPTSANHSTVRLTSGTLVKGAVSA